MHKRVKQVDDLWFSNKEQINLYPLTIIYLHFAIAVCICWAHFMSHTCTCTQCTWQQYKWSYTKSSFWCSSIACLLLISALAAFILERHFCVMVEHELKQWMHIYMYKETPEKQDNTTGQLFYKELPQLAHESTCTCRCTYIYVHVHTLNMYVYMELA